jgi:hypothetical protein
MRVSTNVLTVRDSCRRIEMYNTWLISRVPGLFCYFAARHQLSEALPLIKWADGFWRCTEGGTWMIRDGIVGIEAGPRAGGQGFESRQGEEIFLFIGTSRLAPGAHVASYSVGPAALSRS